MTKTDLEYKNYSLEKLSEFLQDALQSDATPTEIYNTIITTLKKEVSYHVGLVVSNTVGDTK